MKSGVETYIYSWVVAGVSVLAAKGGGGRGALGYNKRLPRKPRTKEKPRIFDFMRMAITRLE